LQIPTFPGLVENYKKLKSKTKKKVGSSNQNNSYRVINNAMEIKEIYTTNCAAFKGKLGGICKNCLREYQSESLGYCCKKIYIGEILKYLTRDNYNCSPACALGYLDSLRIDTPRTRLEYTTLTEEMYKLHYPDQVISKSNDWRLLASGSCDLEDWNFQTYTFEKLERVEIVPTKEEYLKR